MKLKELIRTVDAETARSFVIAARHVVDAMLLEAERIEQTVAPGQRDYAEATLPRTTPAGGWLSHDEIRNAAQLLAEATATEKWQDGAVAAVRLFGLIGGGR